MKLAGFDIESKGVDVGYALQPFRARTGEAWLTTCAISTTDHGTVGMVRPDKEYLKRFLLAMAERGITICGWNVPFDMAWLIAMGLRDEVYACKWLDGMMLWRHLTASPEWTLMAPKSYGLKHAVATILPAFAGYDDGIDFDDDSPEGLAKLLEYNKRDALYTVMLCQGFLTEMTDAQRRCALIEAQCLPMAAETMVEGIKGNREKALALSEKLDDASSEAIARLTIATEKIIDPAVLSSPVKLRDLLFKEWGLKPVKQTAKGADSTDRDALSQLAEVDPRAALLNDYREAKNNRTKFAEGMIKSLDYNGDGYTRPALKPYGTYTGRCTVGSKVLRGKDERPTGYPLHQMKRAPEFRDLIEAPDGYTMMELDWAAQEVRWMAVMSGDPNLLQACEPGEDAHCMMGARMSGVDYQVFKKLYKQGDSKTKEMRQMGKVGVLSCAYRTSANTLQRVARVQYKLDLTIGQARAIHGTYRTTYPYVPMYWKRQIELARQRGWVETIAGRRVHVGTEASWTGVREIKGEYVPFDNTWGCESTAINFPIQGSGAEQKYLGLMALRNLLAKYDGRLYYEMHDGLTVVCPDRYAEKLVHEGKHLLSNLPYKKAWGVDFPIQFPVDAKMGKSWGSMKEVE